MGQPAVRVVGGSGSGFSHRAEVALRLKGVPYELIQEDMGEKSERLLLTHSSSAHRTLPVLLHGDGRAVYESLVIVEYVDEAFDGPPLLPTDPHGRAAARFWARFIDQKFARPFWMSFLAATNDGGGGQEDVLKEARQNLLLLEGQLKGRRFFGGDAIGLVDIAASGFARWIGVFEEISGVSFFTDEDFPELRRWAERYADEEAVKQCLPGRDELVAIFTACRDTLRAMAAPPIK